MARRHVARLGDGRIRAAGTGRRDRFAGPRRALPPAPPAVALRDAPGTVDTRPPARAWIDSQGTATIAELTDAEGLQRFDTAPAD
ncbi:MAG: hypothetical protein JWP65_3858, partial [Ramlibacter sp.]|uniref:hypothetical protein n=1 Tax=Ramlibacter sp. TaxID=1917967 RepID=UPI0026327941